MRKEYIQKQRENGRKILATLPIFYPKEILTGLDILSVEVWGPPGIPTSADAGRIQMYVCPIVRNAMAFLSGGGGEEMVDGIFFPHTCDSIQGLASVLPDLAEWKKPCFYFVHPKGERRDSTVVYLKEEFKSLVKDLEEFTGNKLTDDKFKEAILLHRKIDELKLKILDKRANLDANDTELYSVLRRGDFLWPEDHLKELEELSTKLKDEPVQTGVPILVSGIVPEPASIFENLNDAGAYVAADDYAAIGRRIIDYSVKEINDPFDTMVDMYFAAPPCSTRASLVDFRRQFLTGLKKKSGAKGVIIHNIKFCEPELFDVPHLKKLFEDTKTPLLYMESELEQEMSGQSVTRIEAFVEMVTNRGDRS